MKRTRIHRTLAAVGLFTLMTGAIAAATESLSVLLQKGIFAEETEGNLEAAIKIYRGIAEEAEANRPLVAQAQYRLAVCYQKQGKKDEAATTLQRLIERFPSENDLLRTARARLGELGHSNTPSVLVRKVWADADDTGGGITSDGRYLSFVDWDTGDLAVRDLATSQNRRLTDKGSWDKSDEFAESSVFSPDGRQLAYSWFDGKKDFELRIMSLTDSKPRTLLILPWFWPTDWSADGKRIAVVSAVEKKEYAIGLVSVSDGSVRTVRSLGWRNPIGVRFSPDGRFLAYSCPGETNRESDIFLYDLTSGTESAVVQHPADDSMVAWTPDGSGLLFSSDRRNSTDLWLLPIRDGKTTGEPRLVKTDCGQATPIGITRNGSLYYGIHASSSDFYSAAIDLNSGKLKTAPRKVPTRYTGPRRNVRLSLDGQHLCYVRDRRPSPVLHVIDLETAQEREFVNLPPEPWRNSPDWQDDNRTVIFRSIGTDLRLTLFDTLTGESQTLLNDKPEADKTFFQGGRIEGQEMRYIQKDSTRKKFVLLRHSLTGARDTGRDIMDISDPNASFNLMVSRDMKSLNYMRTSTDPLGGVSAFAAIRNLESGDEVELLSSNKRIIARPGDHFSALATDNENGGLDVRIFNVAAMPPRQQFTVELPRYSILHWWADTPEAHYLLFQKTVADSTGSRTELWTISGKNGEIRQTELSMPRLTTLQVGRTGSNGTKIYFQSGTEQLSEVWAMENFLPPVAAAK